MINILSIDQQGDTFAYVCLSRLGPKRIGPNVCIQLSNCKFTCVSLIVVILFCTVLNAGVIA